MFNMLCISVIEKTNKPKMSNLLCLDMKLLGVQAHRCVGQILFSFIFLFLFFPPQNSDCDPNRTNTSAELLGGLVRNAYDTSET